MRDALRTQISNASCVVAIEARLLISADLIHFFANLIDCCTQNISAEAASNCTRAKQSYIHK